MAAIISVLIVLYFLAVAILDRKINLDHVGPLPLPALRDPEFSKGSLLCMRLLPSLFSFLGGECRYSEIKKQHHKYLYRSLRCRSSSRLGVVSLM